MTEAVPWVKWRFDRWRTEETLRMCSLAARGLWADLLAIMHGATPYGHLAVNGRAPTAKQIASLVGMTTEREVASLLTEMEEAGVFSRSPSGLIYCRRMVRDGAAREKGKATGSLGGNPMLIGNNHEKDNVNSSDRITEIGERGLSPPVNPEKREERREGEEKRASLSGASEKKNFDRFLAAYPNKADPDAAWRAWLKAILNADPEEIIAGVSVYPFKPDPGFHPKPAKWLNDGGWKVTPNTPPPVAVKPPDPEAASRRIAKLQDWLDQLAVHHGDAIARITHDELDRAMLKGGGAAFTRWLDAIRNGDEWVLAELGLTQASPA